MSLNEASPPPAVSELSVTATLDQDALRAHADEAVAMLKVLGNVDRLMLLCQLSQQERTVGELEQLTGISQPTLSSSLECSAAKAWSTRGAKANSSATNWPTNGLCS